MKKSSLFISSVLSSFILAVLAGVVVASHGFAASSTQTALQPPAPVAQVSAPAAILPQNAAQIAAQFIGRNDLYSAESVAFNGANAYKVIFSSGDVVYVSQQGQVLNVVQAPVNNPNTSPAAPLQPIPSTGDEHGAGHGD
jgi:hypothetical protein